MLPTDLCRGELCRFRREDYLRDEHGALLLPPAWPERHRGPLIFISASASFANEVPRVGHGDPLLEVVLRHQIRQVVAMFPHRPEGMRGFRLPVFRSCSYDKLHLIPRTIEVVVARSQAACCFPIQAMSVNALPHARTVLASTLEPTEIPDAKRGNCRSVSR